MAGVRWHFRWGGLGGIPRKAYLIIPEGGVSLRLWFPFLETQFKQLTAGLDSLLALRC